MITSQADDASSTDGADASADQLVQSADTDGDGKLSLDEVKTALSKASDTTDASSIQSAVAALDTDGDGDLSTAEISAGLKSAHGSHHPHGPPPSGGADGGQAPSASDLASSIISSADTDGDGKLSLDELTNALGSSDASSSTASTSDSNATGSSDLTKAFASLDGDGDGKLSASDLTSAIQSFLAAQANFGAQNYDDRHASSSTTVSVAA